MTEIYVYDSISLSDFLRDCGTVKGFDFGVCVSPESHVLSEQRKAAYDTVMEIEFESDELLDDVQYIADTISYYNQKDEEGCYTPFCSMITYCLQHELLD